ncbi:unnamed protein product, partial [Adineta steineri]
MFPNKKSTAVTTGHKAQRLMISSQTEAIASSAQQRIYMDDKLYFSASELSIYNITVPLQIKRGSVSIEHIRSSLVSMIQQHTVLRTAVRFSPTLNQIEQNIQPFTDDIYSFQHSRGVSTLEQLDHLLKNERIGKYFDVENGKVLRCHAVQRSPENRGDLLHESDLIIFVIHHIAFDLGSTKPFLKAFELACWTNEYHQPVLTVPQYIDFALYEQTLLADTNAESKMNKARRFWANLMHGYNWDKIRYLVPSEGRTDRLDSGRGYTTAFTIDQDVVDAMMLFASTNNVTMFSLSLACYYAFLFKLTNHNDDLCVVSSAANRSEKELQDMIGMFVNLLLYRVKIESNNTFKHLVEQVQQLSNEILVHSSLPYQQIIDSQGTQKNNALPSMFFQYEPLILSITQKNSIELNLSEGSVVSAPASYAQARIWFDKRIRFDPDKPQIAIYDMPFVYHLQPGHTLSIKRLLHALQLIVPKHQSLHTSLVFDTKKNQVIQRIVDMNDNNRQLFTFIQSTYETDEQLNQILHDQRRNPHLFDLAQGLVFRCHLVYYQQISSNDILSDKDLLIFNFHHAQFDFPSMEVFLRDLNQAYTTGQLSYDDNTTLRYIDYAVIEQQMSMTGASMFWLDALHDCKLDQPLSLPYDRYRLSNEHRTGRGTSVSFDFGQDLSHDFLIHASSNNISLEHLTFAIYFIFLFKLTNGQTDLCIAMNINNNRYRDEFKSIIGLFENVIPLRCQLDPHWCFHQLLEHVREMTTNSMKYSYFPLQRILNRHPHISKYAFLDISLDFISYTSNNDNNAMMIGDSQLVPGSCSFDMHEAKILSQSDFSLSIHHNININQLSCTINGSLDLFNRGAVEKISQRFHSILHQLSTSIIDNQMNKPIYKLSLILSNEQLLLQSLNNTQISFSSPRTCIHHEFVYQVIKHPQKLAVELDEQSLSYCELLYYVQVLSFTLLNDYLIAPGKIVCQCVERSLSMVIGIMGIEMAGGVYCPLSPRDPQHRLYALTQQTRSRLVLVHHKTQTKFHPNIVLLDIDLIVSDSERGDNSNTDGLSNVLVVAEDMAYIIFTSGSTGTPKAAQVRRRNFNRYMYSLVCGDVLKEKDTIMQISRCSFDTHVQDIMGTLIIGATLVMLHPGGIIDLPYLADVIKKKNVTCFTSVPTILQHLFSFLKHSNDSSYSTSLRCVCTGGEICSVNLVNLILSSLTDHCELWNFYGPAEATIVCTYHRVNLVDNIQSISIGKPLSNYRCMIMSEYLQSSVTDEEGELCVGGLGVFAGYLGRDDLTAKAL